MTVLRVALADDHPIVLAGMRALLQQAPEIVLVGEATSGPEALRLVGGSRPDIAVIDISLPGLGGVELAQRLALDCPGVRVLVLTVHEDRAYVQQMLQAGARGYVLKRSAAEELVRAIRAVAAGGVFLDPAVAGKALSGENERGAGPNGDAALSQREEAVLRSVARGLTNKEIAARLGISVKTVETYRARAAEKLGLRSRADIVRLGARRGWLEGAGQA